jgi:hypothetical protein
LASPLDPASAVQTSTQSGTELIPNIAVAAAPLVPIVLPRTDLVPMPPALRVGVTPINASPAAATSLHAALEGVALAESEWIDEVADLSQDRRGVHAIDSVGERVSLSHSTAESKAPESAREPAQAPRAHDTDRATEILKQIRLRLAPEMRQATIQLAPPELGRVSIHLTLEDRRLTADVRSERRETLEVLGRHLPELRAALAVHGIEAEHFELSLGFQRDPRAQGDDRERAMLEPSMPLAEPISARSEPLTRALASAGGVDLYA